MRELAEERFEKWEIVDTSVFFEEAIRKDPINDETLLSYYEFFESKFVIKMSNK